MRSLVLADLLGRELFQLKREGIISKSGQETKGTYKWVVNLPCWAVKASVCLHIQIYCGKDVSLNHCSITCLETISNGLSQELI